MAAPGSAVWCSRCRSRLENEPNDGRTNTPAAALAVSAILLFPLAALTPFLRIEQLGYAAETSLLGGVRSLLAGGHHFVGGVVLLFSIVVPAFKLLTLLTLSLMPRWMKVEHRAATYRAVEQLGRWGMLDVLLVAIMVAFVKLGDLVAFDVGLGLYFFVAFVALNLLAGMSFNPHLLWGDAVTQEQMERERTGSSGAVKASTEQQATAPAPLDASTDELAVALTQNPRHRAWWLLPAAVAVLVAACVVQFWPAERARVSITFSEGHGLRAGDPIRYLGIDVGEVEELKLDADGGGVVAVASLSKEAASLARAGTLWWIARPQVSLSGAGGLDTVLGPKYITLQAGEGDVCSRFVGLDVPPLADLQEPGGLDIVVQATAGPRLSVGAGVFYRGVRIGGVRSTGLASDASVIEYAVYIRPRFTKLITTQTRFWETGGLQFGLGLDGVTVRIDSLGEVLTGGMAIAVPERGQPVPPGYRFRLAAEPDDEWLEWNAVIGEVDEEASVVRPESAMMTVSWTPSGWIERWWGRKTRRAVVFKSGDRFATDGRVLAGTASSDRAIQIGGTFMRVRAMRPAERESVVGAVTSRIQLPAPVDAFVVGANGAELVSAAQWNAALSGFELSESLSIADGSLLLSESGEFIATVIDHHLYPADPSTLVVFEPLDGQTARGSTADTH